MDVKSTQHRYVQFESGAGITIFKAGSEKRSVIVLVPGGPGLGSQYLLPLVADGTSDVTLLGFEYPDCEENFSRLLDQSFDELQKWLQAYQNITFIGHSAGAMFLLKNGEKLRQNVRGLILIAGAPDGRWTRNADAFSMLHQFPGLDRAFERFRQASTPENLRELFKSWAPFYFCPVAQSVGPQLFDHIEYRVRAFLGRSKTFSENHHATQIPEHIHLTLIHGDMDPLTPPSVFEGHQILNHKLLELSVISNAGHFPWIEQGDAVRSILTRRII